VPSAYQDFLLSGERPSPKVAALRPAVSSRLLASFADRSPDFTACPKSPGNLETDVFHFEKHIFHNEISY
jgi:hypothetical protein